MNAYFFKMYTSTKDFRATQKISMLFDILGIKDNIVDLLLKEYSATGIDYSQPLSA